MEVIDINRRKKIPDKNTTATSGVFWVNIAKSEVNLCYKNCRVTSFSPHLSRNRKWAQQAQYNRFVREWVKELG